MFKAYFKSYTDACLFGYDEDDEVEVLSVNYDALNSAFLIRDKSMHVFRWVAMKIFYTEPIYLWKDNRI